MTRAPATAPYAAFTALSLCLSAAPALAGSFTYSDGVCRHRVAYDAKVDGARLEATFDHLSSGDSLRELPDQAATDEQIAAIDVPAYRARCAAHHDRIAGLRLLDDPRVEALRTAELTEFDTTCKLAEASLAAMKGDLAPARALASACTRYTDLLALPPERLKAQWNDLVVDLCTTSTERNVCAGHLQRSGEGPGSPARRRIALVERWSECATRPVADTDAARTRMLALLAKRFKAKALSCAQ